MSNVPTRDELLEEINQLLETYPPRLSSDVTVKDIMEEKGKSRNSALGILRRISIAHPDKYEMVKVNNENGGWQWALRKKT